MKSISNLQRLGALILAGGIVVATASAGETTATRDMIMAQANTARTTMPATTRTSPLTTEQLVARLDHAWLGAMAKDSQAPAGRIHHSAPDVRLTKVYQGSPAYHAGLRPGDVIWKFDGARLKSTAQLKYELRHEKAGTVVPVEIFHHGQREDLKVKLGAARTAHLMPRGTRVFILG